MGFRSTLADTRETAVLTSIHDVNENQWNNLITQSDRGSLFHRYEWLAAVEAGLDCEPCHIVVTKDANPIAVMPNFVSELRVPNPAVDALATTAGLTEITSARPGYGGPVVISEEKESIDRMLDVVDATGGPRDLYHLIRTFDLDHIRYGKCYHAHGYEPVLDMCVFMIDLRAAWETIYGGMDKERRKSIREALEQHHAVEIIPFGNSMDRTYEWYTKNISRVNGRRVPRSFFEAVEDELGDRVRVFTAVVSGEEVGRYIYLIDEERSVLHHWLSAIPDESCFASYPSELLHERAIRWGSDRGYDCYSFGLTGAYFDNSIFQYKSKYGGRAIPVLWWEKSLGRVKGPMVRFARSKLMQQAI